MSYIVRMPKLGVEMQTGVLLEWKTDANEEVAEGDVLAEIESEKTVAEVAAREDGLLRQTFLDKGAEVEPGTPMGIVAPADEDLSELLAEIEVDNDESTTQDSAEKPSNEPEGTSGDDSADQSREPTDVKPPETDIAATPKARTVAREHGVTLGSIRGTGPKGAVTVADVERVIQGDESADTTPGAPGISPAETESESTGELLATPRARKRAAELDVELATVSGSGPHGSIRAADVEEAPRGESGSVSSQTATETGIAGTTTDARTLREERSMSGMRSTIARRLGESYRNIPHVTVDRAIDIEAALAAADSADSAVSVTDVVLKAVSETLDTHPEFNATFTDDVHRLYEEHNLGIAVDIEQGLVTPVLENVGDMSVVEIAHRRRALVDRVQGRRYDTDDLQGGTFTISNLGVLGIDSFTPIINPPEVAILGVNRIRDVPRRTERGIEFRREMGFSLSFDHRVVDGADAARFLDTLAETLEDVDHLIE